MQHSYTSIYFRFEIKKKSFKIENFQLSSTVNLLSFNIFLAIDLRYELLELKNVIFDMEME